MERKKIILKLNHIFFWWYYKNVPTFFRHWPMLKSIKLLVQNYEHSEFRNKGLNEVLLKASEREIETRTKMSSMSLQLKGISQDKVDFLNKVFKTELKGKSKQELEN